MSFVKIQRPILLELQKKFSLPAELLKPLGLVLFDPKFCATYEEQTHKILTQKSNHFVDAEITEILKNYPDFNDKEKIMYQLAWGKSNSLCKNPKFMSDLNTLATAGKINRERQAHHPSFKESPRGPSL